MFKKGLIYGDCTILKFTIGGLQDSFFLYKICPLNGFCNVGVNSMILSDYVKGSWRLSVSNLEVNRIWV